MHGGGKGRSEFEGESLRGKRVKGEEGEREREKEKRGKDVLLPLTNPPTENAYACPLSISFPLISLRVSGL